MGQYLSPEGEVISHLNISSVQSVDGGLYKCSAKNNVGVIHHLARLNVYGNISGIQKLCLVFRPRDRLYTTL